MTKRAEGFIKRTWAAPTPANIDWKKMGRGGETWVIAQAVLLLLFAFVSPIGPPWPSHDISRFAGWGLVDIASASPRKQ